MTFAALVRALGQSTLAQELQLKLIDQPRLRLSGAGRLPQGLVASALAQAENRPLLVICPTLEEAGRWAAQLETMGWPTVSFYPTSEASPYEPFDLESELVWGQLQVLADLVGGQKPGAIVATERALQPHLPPPEQLAPQCLPLRKGQEINLTQLGEQLAQLGYERVNSVDSEGQWARRGDIIDLFPVASELPVRLELFGDELERLREFDPASQRSLDQLTELVITPTSYLPLIRAGLRGRDLSAYLSSEEQEAFEQDQPVEGLRRLMGLAFARPANLLDYLPADCLVAVEDPAQAIAHGNRWLEQVEEHRASLPVEWPRLHCEPAAVFGELERFTRLDLETLHEVKADDGIPSLNLSARPVPAIPHQFGKLADQLRGEREKGFGIWLVSAQPSRTVALLQEHDCPAQFIPNPKDFPAIAKLQEQKVPTALKYSGLAELEGFILPTFRTVVVTDREFFGQHSLASPGYVRKRRRAASKQIDPNKLRPGDYVVHRNHGIGRFAKLESLTVGGETREYLVIQYADGVLRVAADQFGTLSRFRANSKEKPVLNSMTGKAWEKTKAKARKAIQKIAVDLLKLYAQRAQQQGHSFPVDQPWQQELEDSFPYAATPDQLQATADVKRDMESDRPMDRLVCGDVGFGKTEVAIRAIFKAVTSGKQVAMLAPTTILTQQHYHTLKERFAPYPIRLGLLNRFRTAGERKRILDDLARGELDIVVGTHQLLGKGTQFHDLGLLVVDEEQRFGVNQKEKIKQLKASVDVLTLSATPIPRTLYMALSGVREMSLITTPPPSRRPIMTHLAPLDPETVRSAIRQELDRGGQVFYVVPRVEGIEGIAARLIEMIPSLRVAVAHGQMDEGELESTMLGFNNGEADLMVCTTIIESGLDIPRVNTILIEDAHRFGLSQLYQLRGRVGRSGIQAHAWLFYPDAASLSDQARQRLRAIQEFATLGSGYQLAMRDMEIRGVGNLLGMEQSGQMDVIGFELYMEMLEEAIAEIRGQEIPAVDDTQVDLPVTAFIPGDYIAELDDKMAAYRTVAAAPDKRSLTAIAADWSDRYGPLPKATQQLLRVMELKQVAKAVGFSRIRPEGKQHVILETPMEAPAWKLLAERLPSHLHSRFVYSKGQVTVRGLGVMGIDQQLESLIDWLGKLQGALPEATAPAVGTGTV